jgi:tripartite-type tricarboxylate transporter receptor subunit TctC
MSIRAVGRLMSVAACIVGTTAFAPVASAQGDAAAYPSKPIRIIVGFSAGGGNDILARLIGQKLSESLSQPVVIDNKPGASAIIATEYVKNATPDGYTLLMGAIGAMSINPAVYSKLPYATLRDFVPISMLASFPLIMVINNSAPYKTVQELIAYAKANPDKANYASSSPAFQLTTELFKMKTGTPMQHISYRGSGESVMAVISGTVLTTIADTIPLAGQLKAGQVRAIAVTSAKRIEEFPDIPTMAEAGVADMEVGLWTGLWVPAGTPSAIAKKLQDEVIRAVKDPEINKRMRALGVEPVGNTSEEYARIVEADIARWTSIAKANNIKIEQ